MFIIITIKNAGARGNVRAFDTVFEFDLNSVRAEDGTFDLKCMRSICVYVWCAV